MILLLVLLCVLFASVGGYLLIRRRRYRKNIESVLREADTFHSPDYETTAIDQYLYDRCCRYMTEKKPFLVEGFNLGDLATAIYSNKVYLSKTINHYSGKNFRQYVNYYRVMYAADLFRKNMRYKVSELAEMSGFHTTTTFNQAFKKALGVSPSIWCAEMRRGRRKRKV